MEAVKLTTGIFLGISILGFRHNCFIVGIYFGLLAIMGIVVLIWTYKKEKEMEDK